jgi:hypothetical protein
MAKFTTKVKNASSTSDLTLQGNRGGSAAKSESDRLLLLAPSVPKDFGVVAASEERGDFSDGDVVKFIEPEQIQDCGNGSFVFVSPAKCQKVTDPELAEAYRCMIYRGC